MKAKFAALGMLLLGFSCATRAGAPASPETQNLSIATPLTWSQRLADSEMARRADSLVWQPGGRAKWDYSAGLFTLSLLRLNAALAQTTGAPVSSPPASARYVEFAAAAIGSFLAPDGRIHTYDPNEFQLDALNSGKTALALWHLTQAQRYRAAAFILHLQLSSQPRTPGGGWWHKLRYTNQMWLDGIYMASPFYAECGQEFGESRDSFEVVNQIRLIDQHTYDARTGLNYHGWDASRRQPWADPQSGCSSNFWGRAEGWYAMGLVDLLDFLPAHHPDRDFIVSTLQKTARGIVKWQEPATGLWWQVMDQGKRPGNYLEATCSAMFVAALAKGVNRGYLSRNYVPAIKKGYQGMLRNFVRDDGNGKWSLTQCCSVAGLGFKNAAGRNRDGSFDYYCSEPIIVNDLKGVGPFILAGIEVGALPSPSGAGRGF
jgi:unsaturated rhamnogalacturonyl hydrolase